jgi:AraC-like DNA-binding protein
VELEFAPIPLQEDFPLMCAARTHRPAAAPIRRLHIHDCLEIGYCHSGSGIFAIEDKVFSFRAGDVSVINDREMHLARSAKRTGSEWTFMSLDPLRLVGMLTEETDILGIGPLGGPEFRNILPGNAYPDIAHTVRDIISEMKGTAPAYRSSVRGMVLTLMARLHRLPGLSSNEARERTTDRFARLAPAMQHMAAHFGEAIRMEDLAGLCHASPTHLRRLFQKAVGESPLRYLTRLRIQMAATLLETTNRTVLDISMEVGYPSISSFNRHFRSVMAMSPRQWRRRA